MVDILNTSDLKLASVPAPKSNDPAVLLEHKYKEKVREAFNAMVDEYKDDLNGAVFAPHNKLKIQKNDNEYKVVNLSDQPVKSPTFDMFMADARRSMAEVGKEYEAEKAKPLVNPTEKKEEEKPVAPAAAPTGNTPSGVKPPEQNAQPSEPAVTAPSPSDMPAGPEGTHENKPEGAGLGGFLRNNGTSIAAGLIGLVVGTALGGDMLIGLLLGALAFAAVSLLTPDSALGNMLGFGKEKKEQSEGLGKTKQVDGPGAAQQAGQEMPEGTVKYMRTNNKSRDIRVTLDPVIIENNGVKQTFNVEMPGTMVAGKNEANFTHLELFDQAGKKVTTIPIDPETQSHTFVRDPKQHTVTFEHPERYKRLMSDVKDTAQAYVASVAQYKAGAKKEELGATIPAVSSPTTGKGLGHS